MASKRWERRNEIARSLGYTNYYWLRKDRARQKLGEQVIDEKLERALYFQNKLNYSQTRAAREAHVAPERLAAVTDEFGFGVTKKHRGETLMMSYVEGLGIVYVALDDHEASRNGSYLNYVRWTFHKTNPKTKKAELIAPINKRNLGKFRSEEIGEFLATHGHTFHAKTVYKTTVENGMIMMQPDPYDYEVDLDWEAYLPRIIELERQRSGATTSVYARR